MKITSDFSNFSSTKKTILTIGTFDGVHVGHQKIIEQLLSNSKASNEQSVILTFFPHPRMVLQKDFEIKLINTLQEKSLLLEQMGLDHLIVHPFNKEFSRMTAFEFVREVLVNKLNISKLIIGYDHHFGKNREGNFEQLQEYGNMFGFELEEIPAQYLNDVTVSSTKIRNALLNGQIQTANNYLGYEFSITGTVTKGNNIGSKLGYPTANISVEEPYKLIPKNGVYVVKSNIKEKEIFGMMNIGNRPTIDGKSQTIEVNFLNFKGNLYDQTITVKLIQFLREEIKFESLDELKLQLQKDQSISQDIIHNLTSIS
ncbi:bifunctional riboflavin kinase/FAD synthetase [Urechidicola sp. KH5]